MKIIILNGFTLLLCAVSITAFAAQCNIGRVNEVAGNAKLERKGRLINVGTDVLLCKGDKFITDSSSVIKIKFRDGSLITVGKDSEFTVAEYKIFLNKPNVALFELTKGAFRAVTGFITHRPHRYEVKTAVATIGVRGTDFWGGYGLTENGLDVVMLSGKGVYVKNNQGETTELDAAGLGTTVLVGSAPSQPIKWDAEKVAKAVETITPAIIIPAAATP